MNDDELIELMEHHGIKSTANRIIIARALVEGAHPMTMMELEDQIGSIDKSGIFRALSLFKERQLVHVLEDSEGLRYEICHSHDHGTDNDTHVHFHCERCGETICLTDIPIPNIDLPEGYRTISANFMLKGFCPKCQNK